MWNLLLLKIKIETAYQLGYNNYISKVEFLTSLNFYKVNTFLYLKSAFPTITTVFVDNCTEYHVMPHYVLVYVLFILRDADVVSKKNEIKKLSKIQLKYENVFVNNSTMYSFLLFLFLLFSILEQLSMHDWKNCSC